MERRSKCCPTKYFRVLVLWVNLLSAHFISLRNDVRENDAFSDDYWKHPDAEIAVNDLYGSYEDLSPRNGQKPDSDISDTGQKPTGQSCYPQNDGHVNDAFSDDRWQQPDAEIAVNELYGSLRSVPHRNKNQPEKNSRVDSEDDQQTYKTRGLNYQQVEFEKGQGNPNVSPQESPVTYADIRTLQKKNSRVDNEDDQQTSKTRGLNYQQVEFEKGEGNSNVRPRESPVTYADIRTLQSQKADSNPVVNDGQTESGVADNTTNALYESESFRKLPPRDNKPPHPERIPTQSQKPFPKKKPLPNPTSVKD